MPTSGPAFTEGLERSTRCALISGQEPVHLPPDETGKRPETPHSSAQRREFRSAPRFLDGPLLLQRHGGHGGATFLERTN
ncbi:hypothetical protein KUCAC02_019345 [Chaenocephalus aceratus]|uniref:Uncharacterized protein n=1 Tax=Chaenocephalus aceratus TaxID=36190 RepID=A0ACB9VNT8_CHAAC|nr:hypothetical protein KUCAC02_019345 [Chaenocephalus aceratus]